MVLDTIVAFSPLKKVRINGYSADGPLRQLVFWLTRAVCPVGTVVGVFARVATFVGVALRAGGWVAVLASVGGGVLAGCGVVVGTGVLDGAGVKSTTCVNWGTWVGVSVAGTVVGLEQAVSSSEAARRENKSRSICLFMGPPLDDHW